MNGRAGGGDRWAEVMRDHSRDSIRKTLKAKEGQHSRNYGLFPAN